MEGDHGNGKDGGHEDCIALPTAAAQWDGVAQQAEEWLDGPRDAHHAIEGVEDGRTSYTHIYSLDRRELTQPFLSFIPLCIAYLSVCLPACLPDWRTDRPLKSFLKR